MDLFFSLMELVSEDQVYFLNARIGDFVTFFKYKNEIGDIRVDAFILSKIDFKPLSCIVSKNRNMSPEQINDIEINLGVFDIKLIYL